MTIDRNTIPNFTGLEETMRSYFKVDWEEIEQAVHTKFGDSDNSMDVLDLRFFTKFIDSAANLFTQSYQQDIDFKGFIEFDEFNEARVNSDRYLEACVKSAVMVKFTQDYKLELEALDATQYFKDNDTGNFFLKYKDNVTLAYIHEVNEVDIDINQFVFAPQNFNNSMTATEKILGVDITTDKELQPVGDISSDGENGLKNIQIKPNELTLKNKNKNKNIKIFLIEQKLEDAVKSYVDLKTCEDKYKPLGEMQVMPFIERSKYRQLKALPNTLVKMEKSFIEVISWGWHNVKPKLLTQTGLTTQRKVEEVAKAMKGYGKTGKVILMGQDEKLSLFDMGDISVLKDAFIIKTEILSEKALEMGVSKSSIIPQKNENESGEHAKVELEEINSIRTKKFAEARNFDRKLVALMEEMSGQDFNYEGIKFLPLEKKSDPIADIDYADKMVTSDYFTDAEAYAYVRQVTVEEAEGKIKELNKIQNNTDNNEEKNIKIVS